MPAIIILMVMAWKFKRSFLPLYIGQRDLSQLIRGTTEQKGRLPLTHLSYPLVTYFCLTLICSVLLDTVGDVFLVPHLSPACGSPGSNISSGGWRQRGSLCYLPCNCNLILRKELNFKSTEQLFETRYFSKAAGPDSLLQGSLIRKWPRWPPFK